jgi:L,D-transpeptidase catalytic domain
MFFDKALVRRATGGRRMHGWALAAGLVLSAAPASANILITIDKSTQQMSVAIDGADRYVWPVSTGRPGYDTPSGTFKPNRMDADHYSQEWDNAPMPHAIFFDLDGHAIHGFFDVKHLGRAVSHGCVRLSPDHAQTLFNLVKTQGMGETKVVVAGYTPGGDNGPVARSHLPRNETVSSEPTQIAPGYGRDASPYYGGRSYGQSGYGQPSYQSDYAQRGYGRSYQGQSYQGQSYYGQYTQPGYAPSTYPPQPPPVYAPPSHSAPGYWQR